MEFKKIGVVGAGMMGAEIALCFARKGMNVVLSDINEELAAKGKEKQALVLEKNVKKGRITHAEKEATLAKVCTTADLSAMRDCDLVIEAVLEVLEVKHDTYRQLDEICKPETVIASNTSSISITKLAAAVSKERQERFIGMHFNSPASVMKLVEVIPALLTEEKIVQAVIDLLGEIGKEPVKVKDVVGFALNRLFHIFYLEACRLVEEGVCTVEDVDKICLYGLGHPVGILKLIDNFGHDLNLNIDNILFDAYGERFRPSAYMQRLYDAGHLGKKSGIGFYNYEK